MSGTFTKLNNLNFTIWMGSSAISYLITQRTSLIILAMSTVSIYIFLLFIKILGLHKEKYIYRDVTFNFKEITIKENLYFDCLAIITAVLSIMIGFKFYIVGVISILIYVGLMIYERNHLKNNR